MDQHAVCSLAAEAPLLAELDLRGCKLVGDLVLVTLAKHCKLLTKLRLSKCTSITNEGVAALAGCSKLSHLDLASCKQVGDGGVATLIRRTADRHGRAGIQNVGGGEKDRAVLDAATTVLQVLDVSSTSITSSTVHMVAAYCSMLRCFQINQCDGVTLVSVEAAVESCTFLEELGLCGCSSVATSDARRLQSGRPGLLLSR